MQAVIRGCRRVGPYPALRQPAIYPILIDVQDVLNRYGHLPNVRVDDLVVLEGQDVRIDDGRPVDQEPIGLRTPANQLGPLHAPAILALPYPVWPQDVPQSRVGNRPAARIAHDVLHPDLLTNLSDGIHIRGRVLLGEDLEIYSLVLVVRGQPEDPEHRPRDSPTRVRPTAPVYPRHDGSQPLLHPGRDWHCNEVLHVAQSNQVLLVDAARADGIGDPQDLVLELGVRVDLHLLQDALPAIVNLVVFRHDWLRYMKPFDVSHRIEIVPLPRSRIQGVPALDTNQSTHTDRLDRIDKLPRAAPLALHDPLGLGAVLPEKLDGIVHRLGRARIDDVAIVRVGHALFYDWNDRIIDDILNLIEKLSIGRDSSDTVWIVISVGQTDLGTVLQNLQEDIVRTAPIIKVVINHGRVVDNLGQTGVGEFRCLFFRRRNVQGLEVRVHNRISDDQVCTAGALCHLPTSFQ